MISCSSLLEANQVKGVCYCYTDWMLTGGSSCLEVGSASVLLLIVSGIFIFNSIGILFSIAWNVRYLVKSLSRALFILNLLLLFTVPMLYVAIIVNISAQTLNVPYFLALHLTQDGLFATCSFLLAYMWWTIHRQILTPVQMKRGTRVMKLLAVIFWGLFVAQGYYFISGIFAVSTELNLSSELSNDEVMDKMASSIDMLNAMTQQTTHIMVYLLLELFGLFVLALQGHFMTAALKNCIKGCNYEFTLNLELSQLLKEAMMCKSSSFDSQYKLYVENGTPNVHSDLILQVLLVTRAVLLILLAYIFRSISLAFGIAVVHVSYRYVHALQLIRYIFSGTSVLLFVFVVQNYLYRSGCFTKPIPPPRQAFLSATSMQSSCEIAAM